MRYRSRPNEATRLFLQDTARLCARCEHRRRLTKDGRLDAASLCGACLSEATGYAIDRAPSDSEIDAVILSILALDRLSARGFEQATMRLARATEKERHLHAA